MLLSLSAAKGDDMKFGGAMFFTEYSMTAPELAVALEERGYDSIWAPEHSHIPLSRKTPFPGGGELPKQYADAMDPFVVLSAAGCATKTIKLGTGVLLVQQRDTIQTAKLVASIDQVSGGRFLFGIGGGWNQEEIEDHGTAFATRMQKMREQIEAMKAIWTESKPEYHGDIVNFDTMSTWPKPVQKPHPPVILGGAFPWAARRAVRYGDGWYPNAASGNPRSEEHTSELQSPCNLVCRLLLEKKKIEEIDRASGSGVVCRVPLSLLLTSGLAQRERVRVARVFFSVPVSIVRVVWAADTVRLAR